MKSILKLRSSLTGSLMVLLLCSFQSSAQTTNNSNILNCLQPSGHHLYYQDITCPSGGEAFQVLRLGTHSTYGRHLDWKPVSYLDFPAPITVCPSNGFVVAKKDYGSGELERLETFFNSAAYKTLYAEMHASYYLLAKVNQELDEDQDNIWWQLLNATWEANGCGATDKYALYAQETITAAKSQLQKLDKSDNLYWVLNIIIPNLYRRLGEFDQSELWVENMGDIMPKDENTQSYVNLALELLKEATSQKNTAQIAIEARKNAPNK